MSFYGRTQSLFKKRKADVRENHGGHQTRHAEGSTYTLYPEDGLAISYTPVLLPGDKSEYNFSWDGGAYITITRRGVITYDGVTKKRAEELIAETLTKYGV
jgi:hypothetical protein